MNNRKKHVLNKAHELFIEKGFQATSIQEILDSSGISKGTFYNYFSSKNELLISIFKEIYSELGEKRKNLMIGQDKSSLAIFIQQIELLINTNNQYKIISLFEEILFTNDPELKQFLNRRRIQEINWLYNRLMDICGIDKKPYLLDCAVMLTGNLHNLIYFYSLDKQRHTDVHKIVQYSVNRIIGMVEDVSKNGERLLSPDLLLKWLSDSAENDRHTDSKNISCVIESLKLMIKNSVQNVEEQKKYEELVEFVEEELVEPQNRRKHIVQMAIGELKASISDSECQKAICILEDKLKKME
ncbi:TetR/AcrR family transcriptional regulator [Niallia circulans]|nr:TetR/AcrR family transcriptional regulator [Niallia circulans]